MHKKAFTLIELLVVVAIIVILTSIIILNSQIATNKKTDLLIKSNLEEARLKAETYFDRYQNYGNLHYWPRTGNLYCQGGFIPGVNNDGFLRYGSPDPFNSTSDDSAFLNFWNAQKASDPKYSETGVDADWKAVCAIGAPYYDDGGTHMRGQSFVLAVPLKEQDLVSDTSGVDYYCVDSAHDEGIVIDDTAQITGASWLAVASCGQ